MMEPVTPIVDFSRELNGLFDLHGKVAFVPGGYGGIGEAICWGLALHGAHVVVGGRSLDKAKSLAAQMIAQGLHASAVAIDAHSTAGIRAAVDTAAAHNGEINILVNCIGIQREEKLLDVTEEAFDEVVQVNLKSAMFLAQAVAKHQIAAKRGGKHIHLLSVRAQLGLRDRGYSAYCATKGALVMLVKQHAVELARDNIQVNGIAPTVVATEMARHWLENDITRRQIVERIPLGRVATPADVVGAALFFASAASDFVTGQTLYLDGGITASQ
jgi:NAD(P)-dependent dehydrogenase (short-subunit alcohol dehydrogenase family)